MAAVAAAADAAGAERSYDDLKKERDEKLDRLARLLDDARGVREGAEGSAPDQLVARGARPGRRAAGAAVTRREPEAGHPRCGGIRRTRQVASSLTGGMEASLVAPLLKEKNIPVILGADPARLPSREDMFHAASYEAAGELVKAGVKFAFARATAPTPGCSRTTRACRSRGGSRATRRSRR